jgi:uncharacterized protein DUF6788
MTQTLEGLEQRRQELYQLLQDLGDFRPGTISANYRRCGKPSCACAQAGHPGHGPQYLWNTTQGGKSRAESLRLGPELGKVEQELENYRRFQQLCGELVEVNLQICQLRPIPEVRDEAKLEQLKKKLQRKYSRRLSVK